SRAEGRKQHIEIFHFGKYGGLARSMQRGDIVIPTGSFCEKDYDQYVYEMDFKNMFAAHNSSKAELSMLAGKIHTDLYTGPTLHSSSVVLQEKPVLQQFKDVGAVCIDMESDFIARAVETANCKYATEESRGVEAKYWLIGYISDMPLQGDTLAEPFDGKEPQKFVVNAIKEIIL
ncbi:hypothetical protein KY317_02855, partial [Candidatus Woesearchaeota archaeon]|nr:hypothetical protein [Candidatus Woesearchaeota archaeon]